VGKTLNEVMTEEEAGAVSLLKWARVPSAIVDATLLPPSAGRCSCPACQLPF